MRRISHLSISNLNDKKGYAVYKLAICDDETELCASLEKFIHSFFDGREIDYSVKSFFDVRSLDASIKNGAEYDLVFLDIFFKDGNGISYAKNLRAQKSATEIIFITTSREYAIESYDVNPIYYILKPAAPDKLNAAMTRFLEKKAPNYICFNTVNGITKISLSAVLYFGHHVIVHKSDGTEYSIRGTLKDIETQLPAAMFIRPHRSYLVNVEFISEIIRYMIKLTNGENIPVSKAAYNKIQYEFVEYLDRKDLYI